MKLSDLSSPEFYQNPYPFYEELRAGGPVVELGEKLLITGRYTVIDALLQERHMVKDYMASVLARYGEEEPKQYVSKR